MEILFTFAKNSLYMQQVLTTYQMQILESIALVKKDEDMREIRNLIAAYFSKKALDAMDNLCVAEGVTTETIEDWRKEHLRTPYK